jgi:hypothetical protein
MAIRRFPQAALLGACVALAASQGCRAGAVILPPPSPAAAAATISLQHAMPAASVTLAARKSALPSAAELKYKVLNVSTACWGGWRGAYLPELAFAQTLDNI